MTFIKKHKIALSVTAAVLAIIIIALSVAAGVEAAHRNGKFNEAEISAEQTYNWSKDDAFDIDSEHIPSITPKSGDGSIKILQLTDIHFMNQGTFGSAIGISNIVDTMGKNQIRDLVDKTRPDLIAVTGDLITYVNAEYAFSEFVKFIDDVCETFDCKWTFVYGNHDCGYLANKVALSNVLMTSKHILFDFGPTNFYFDSDDCVNWTETDDNGREIRKEGWKGHTSLGNFIIKVLDGDGNVAQALIMMDSNDWNIPEFGDRQYSTPAAGFYPMQTQWYEWAIEGLKAANGGKPLQTSLFAHISPYKIDKTGELTFEERMINGDARVSFVMKDGNEYNIDKSIRANADSTKFLFLGHTHAKGFTYVDETTGIYYTNANKTGYQYADMSAQGGGTLAEIKTVGTTTISHYEKGKVYKTIERAMD